MSHPEQTAVNECAAYYESERSEMLKFLPAGASRVLELGCGEGAFSAAVKQRFGAECWAMEYNAVAAEKAAGVLDRVLVGDADQHIDELPDNYFDAIVCNDVLEHLAYPWVTLERLRPKLRASGVVVASIPNIRFLPALSRIIFNRDFPLEDEGIFDRTHLHFFTRKSIRRMFDTAGYELKAMKGINVYNRARLVAVLSLGFFWDGAFLEYACVASPR
jgi:2-polyprenyl-3-methyl-5-hydroxy-6-metoxy-1,4-benzoquinol methylase